MTHLMAAERGKIEILPQEQYTNKNIALKLGRSTSGIGREIAKGRDGSGTYETNRRRCKQILILDHPANHRLRHEPEWWDLPAFICAETIYHWIYTSAYSLAEKLYQCLRYSKKKRTKHTGRSSHRSKIPNRVSVRDRPPVVAERSRLGDWEGDSVIYTHLYAVNTLSERVNQLSRIH